MSDGKLIDFQYRPTIYSIVSWSAIQFRSNHNSIMVDVWKSKRTQTDFVMLDGLDLVLLSCL